MSTGLVDDLKKERERFVAFAFAAAEIFFEIDTDGKILFESGAVEWLGSGKKKTGSGSMVGELIFDQAHEDDRDILKALMLHLGHKGRIGPMPIRFMSGGRTVPLRLFALRMQDKENRTFLAMRAAPLSGGRPEDDSIDSETGLMKRDDFLEMAKNTMATSNYGNHLYMTVAEVDGLEEASTRHGPRYTRRLLRQIGANLKALSLEGTVAGRVSDRHFAFIHRAQKDGDHFETSVETLSDEVDLKTNTATVKTDIGGLDEDQVIRTLSYVLKQFVHDSQNCDFESISNAYEALAGETQRRVNGMRSIIDSGNFKIAFQPVVTIKGGDVHHYEVLSRFEDSFGDDTPADMIRFAENIGIIEEYDVALVHKTIDYVRKMKRLGEPLTVSVNMSGKTLDSGRYVDSLLGELKTASSMAHNIILELTETTAIENLEPVENILATIKKLGYSICLDDFGAGASGYQYLRVFNVDYVKIDGTYVRDMVKPDYKPTFLMSMIRLCRDLNVKTIGQHVETRFQADFLRSLGIDYAQGFFYGKPSFTPQKG